MKAKPSRFLFAAVAPLLLVAGASRADAPAGRYEILASGTVYDTKTKLTWQQAVPQTGSYTWGGASTAGTAQSYCATLALNGTGWRLPTVGELLTLVDYTQPGGQAMIDPTFFPATPPSAFWSSTPAAGSSSLAWYVYFLYGYSYVVAESGAGFVRCVR
jgi:Protein of unknown function (DUF1566)